MLALQGGVEAHLACFARLGCRAREVRAPHDLDDLTHLVLPGGESTALHHLASLFGLWEEIVERARQGALALFGTCAGAILIGRESPESPPRAGLLDVCIERNAYGTQSDSFRRTLRVAPFAPEFECIFLRAPRITEVGPGVQVLSTCDGDPVLVRSAGLLAATFHPELSGEPALHRHFLELRPTPARELY